ncbi:hypothetical protein GFC01_09730 [Desulfofundulus thermobenzoicus]|uniref:Uncharacterized protein n=1 Tax=Desulfofundulus thermobenzoicus TaxID=29376 RepID=A0A6N7IR35_9FIRM|nr:hypothetical protein [Desulfofundulus thermobenzoicus]MQL52536.1 hypothetical protein [Desulfofundulus thermobenzoicus]
MYPQTHAYFAQRVCGEISEALALGSIFPDMVAALTPGRDESHGRGGQLLNALGEDPEMRDFALGVLTHGTSPEGLDYYGDEKYLHHERGYCFEKGRPLVQETIRACNLPAAMGWWKSHNIVEMGIELHIGGHKSPWGEILRKALENERLLTKISRLVAPVYAVDPRRLYQRMHNFSYYIQIDRITPRNLAVKYDVQMFYKHHIHIDIERTARLIASAREMVTADLEHFFTYVEEQVLKTMEALGRPGLRP